MDEKFNLAGRQDPARSADGVGQDHAQEHGPGLGAKAVLLGNGLAAEHVGQDCHEEDHAKPLGKGAEARPHHSDTGAEDENHENTETYESGDIVVSFVLGFLFGRTGFFVICTPEGNLGLGIGV